MQETGICLLWKNEKNPTNCHAPFIDNHHIIVVLQNQDMEK